jgi:hypothetical protein
MEGLKWLRKWSEVGWDGRVEVAQKMVRSRMGWKG